MNPKNRNTFFSPVKGAAATFNKFVVGLKNFKIKKIFFILYTIGLPFPAGRKDLMKNQFFNPQTYLVGRQPVMEHDL